MEQISRKPTRSRRTDGNGGIDYSSHPIPSCFSDSSSERLERNEELKNEELRMNYTYARRKRDVFLETQKA